MRMRLFQLLAIFAIGCNTSSPEVPGDSSESALPKQPLAILDAGEYSAAAFSPDGHYLALGHDGSITIWDVTRSELVARGSGADVRGSCDHITFSPSGTRLTSVHKFPDFNTSSQLHLWEFKNGTELRMVATLWPLSKKDSVFSVMPFFASFSPDGSRIVAGNGKNASAVWDSVTGQKLRDLPDGPAATYSRDGNTAITVCWDGGIRHWDPNTGKTLDPAPLPARTDFIFTKGISFAPSANRAMLHDDYSVSVKDTKTGKQILRLAFPYGVGSAAISPDGRILVVFESRTGMHVFDATSGAERGSLNAMGSAVFSPDGKHIAWREDKKLVVREMADVLSNAKQPPTPEQSDPPGVPLQLEMVSKKSEYVLDLAVDVRDGPGSRSEASKVDMELVIRNTGATDVELEYLGTPILYLFGDGAINWHVECQTALDDLPPPVPTLSPGQVHRLPVEKLAGTCANSYWLLPGTYTVYAEWYIHTKPALAGTQERDGSGWVRLWSRPIHVKVVAP